MVIRRECRTFIPTIPSTGGPTVFFVEDTEKQEQETFPIDPDPAQTAVQQWDVGPEANRVHYFVGFAIAVIEDDGGNGWAGDAMFFIGGGKTAFDGTLQPSVTCEEEQSGDGLFEVEELEQSAATVYDVEMISQATTDGEACSTSSRRSSTVVGFDVLIT